MQGLQSLIICAASWLACRRDEARGSTAIEYGLIVAFIAAIVIGGVTFLGSRTGAGFNSVTSNFPD